MVGFSVRDRVRILEDGNGAAMIKNWQEYAMLDDIVERANDRLVEGTGESGMHYTLMWILRGYGVWANSREESITAGRKLLREFEMAQEQL